MLFITGVTGLTGRFLNDCLREAGYTGPIRCLVRTHSDVSWITDGNVELHLGDAGDVESLKSGLTWSRISLVSIPGGFSFRLPCPQ